MSGSALERSGKIPEVDRKCFLVLQKEETAGNGNFATQNNEPREWFTGNNINL
jgi:hypothetical protein